MKLQKPVIVTESLVKRFGDFTAVDNVSFEVRAGEIFGFLGPNGSGKTTTIRMMLGLLPPTSGSVYVLGIPIARNPEAVRPRIGYMSQRFSLYGDLTVKENLRFYARAYGLDANQSRKRIAKTIRMAGLVGHENARAGELSGGWRQRLALGAAILHDPELIFLDEPTAGVDPISRRAFWDLLYELAAQGVSVFVTTHYMDEAEHCHQLGLIQKGRLVAGGAPAQLRRNAMQEEVLEVSPSDATAAVRVLRAARSEGRLSFTEVALYGSMVHVVAPQAGELKGVVARELEMREIVPGEMSVVVPSLEDVFVSYMR